MLASGSSPFQVIATQGGQISQIFGDRGVKSVIGGVGQAFMTLLTPVNMALLGVVGLGLAADAAFSGFESDADKATKALDEHRRIIEDVSKEYGAAAIAAAKYAAARTAGLEADARADAGRQRKAMMSSATDFSMSLGSYLDTGAGSGPFVVDPKFGAFADEIRRFMDDVAAGTPNVDAFREAIAEVMNASDDPAVQRAGEEIRKSGLAAQEAQTLWKEASGALDAINESASGAAISVRELVEATNRWIKNDEFVAGLEKQAALQRELASIGDPRQRYVTGELSKLEGDASADQIARATAAAEAMYDAQQRIAAGEKAASDATRERQRLEREWQRDAERVWQSTRTEAEKYAAELERLNELLRRGAIDQETYGRAAAKAAEELAAARKAAAIESLSKSNDPLAGV